MRLFEIDENFNVKPNKVWIGMIPEFKILLFRDKSNNGTGPSTTPDTAGRHTKARKEFAFIYFNVDFGSPIRDWEPKERRKEALKYANLKEEDIDEKINIACKKYEELQLASSRSLRTYRSMMKGVDALDTHFESINFDAIDKQGKQLHSPDGFVNNVGKMNKVYDELRIFEKRVEDDLKNTDSGIRGNAMLGDLEGQRTNVNSTWSESQIAKESTLTQDGIEAKSPAKFTALAEYLGKSTLALSDEEIDNAVILE